MAKLPPPREAYMEDVPKAVFEGMEGKTVRNISVFLHVVGFILYSTPKSARTLATTERLFRCSSILVDVTILLKRLHFCLLLTLYVFWYVHRPKSRLSA